MGIVNENELHDRYESLRKSILDKHRVYLNNQHGTLKMTVTEKKDLTIVDLEEILKAANEMAKLISLKNIHAELLRGGNNA